MQLLDGKAISAKIKLNISEEAKLFNIEKGRKPCLAAILIGNDPASITYVNSKIKNCKEVGFDSKLIKLDNDVTENQLLSIIKDLNNNNDVDGFIVQLPLPKHINADNIIEAIDYKKDIDGFHPINLGRMQRGLPCFISATPLGILTLLEEYNIKTEGKHCVVVGRSNIVGSPISILMSRKNYPGNCSVSIVHSKTPNIKEFTKLADILIVAIGIPNFIKADMVKDGVVIIDVGINRMDSDDSPKGYLLKGDVCFEEVSKKASYITPVPGGVGLMTIASLLKNTLLAAKKEIYE